MTYTVHVNCEDGTWLADVPTVGGAHTYASTLEDLIASVREVIVLMDDLPDNTQVDLDLHHHTPEH